MAGKESIARLLAKHRPTIVRELNVSHILPQLVQKKVFDYNEERMIIASHDNRRRAETFFDILSQKGLGAFHEFFAALENTHPSLLTRFLLDTQGTHFKLT